MIIVTCSCVGGVNWIGRMKGFCQIGLNVALDWSVFVLVPSGEFSLDVARADSHVDVAGTGIVGIMDCE